MPSLFEPLVVGDITLPNRIVSAPVTRTRSGPTRVPNALMAKYYRDRATAGLIVAEATSVVPQGVGYADTPGIWSVAQIQGWRRVTEAVHEAGGRIFLQIWHVGRMSDPVFHNGELPVGPSAIAAQGHVSRQRPERPWPTPRALGLKEIPGIVEGFRQGAQNAKIAGFDGVEIHGANGYLLDQFLQDRANQRDDEYGGSIENRARLMLEVTDACVDVYGAGRVGMHLSPRGDIHTMGDSDLRATFSYVARELGKRKIAFLMTREHESVDSLNAQLKREFGGVLIANEGFTKASAEAALRRGHADAVGWGRDFVANPDLVRRFEINAPLNRPDPSTFYGSGEKGYNDYPLLAVTNVGELQQAL